MGPGQVRTKLTNLNIQPSMAPTQCWRDEAHSVGRLDLLLVDLALGPPVELVVGDDTVGLLRALTGDVDDRRVLLLQLHVKMAWRRWHCRTDGKTIALFTRLLQLN